MFGKRLIEPIARPARQALTIAIIALFLGVLAIFSVSAR